MDVTLSLIVSCFFALLFFKAGIDKFRFQAEFRSTLNAYQLLPEKWIGIAGWVIPSLEVAISIAVLFQVSIAAYFVIALLLAYAAAMAINLQRGNTSLDCGCQLGDAHQSVSYALVVRNGVLAALALTLLLEPRVRDLAAFDFGVMGFGVLMSALIYASANCLIANADRYRELFA